MAFPIDIHRRRQPVASVGDTQTVTVGKTGTTPNRIVGFDTGAALGSISDGTSNIYGGAAISTLEWQEATSELVLNISGTLANSGWTTLTIAGNVYNRAAATFSTGGGITTWDWTGAVNPFAFVAGALKTAVFA